MITYNKRYFLSQMGFDDFNETDVLMNIKDGIYFHNTHLSQLQLKKNPNLGLAFDKKQRILIFDNSSHYILPQPRPIIPILTTITSIFAIN